MTNFKDIDFKTMGKPFQLTKDDIELSNTLEHEDIGYWCVLINGTYQGFSDTEEEAAELYELMS